MYTHFWSFLTIFNYKKSTIGINTYKLTLNKNPILMYTYFSQFLIIKNYYTNKLFKNPIFMDTHF